MVHVLLLFATGLRVADVPPPKITVVVYHAEAVSPTGLAHAERVAGGILRHAGIEAVWRTAGPADVAPQADEIPLHLLSTQPATIGRDASGYAVLMGAGSYAGVSCPAVRRTALHLDVDEAT